MIDKNNSLITINDMMTLSDTASMVWSFFDGACKLYYALENEFKNPDKRLKEAYEKAFNKAWSNYSPHYTGTTVEDQEKREMKKVLLGTMEVKENDESVSKFLRYFKIACAENKLIQEVTSKFEHEEMLSSLEELNGNASRLEAEVANFINKIDSLILSPFGTLRERLGGLYKNEYIPNPALDQMIKEIQAENKPVRITALSGMGKTRLVYEAFLNSVESCYYTRIDNFNEVTSAIHRIIENKPNRCTFIVDDCNFDNHKELIKLHNSVSQSFKLITIYHDLDPHKDNYTKQYKWDKLKFKSLLKNHMQKLHINESAQQHILEISDSNPQLVFSFIEHLQDEDYNITDEHDLFERLIHLSKNQDESMLKEVLKVISIFKSMDIGNNYNSMEIDEIVQLKKMDKICLYNGSDEMKLSLIKDTIDGYEKKQLLDISENKINLRPLPLVFWLIKTWAAINMRTLKESINEIKDSDSDVSDILYQSIVSRFQQLLDYVKKDNYNWLDNENKLWELADEICKSNGVNNTQSNYYSPKNEEAEEYVDTTVVSNHDCKIDEEEEEEEEVYIDPNTSLNDETDIDIESALLEGNSTDTDMTPSLTLEELEAEINKKPIDYLANLQFDSIMKLQRTISYYFMQPGDEQRAMYLMARLAISEGDTYYSNNSKASLKELFQIYIPGTTLDLNSRYQWLKEFASNSEYKQLLPSLFKASLQLGGFTRFNYYYSSESEYTNKDYSPKSNEEIISYNKDMWLLFIDLANNRTIEYGDALEIILERMYETFKSGLQEHLFDVFEELFDHTTDWEDIRIRLKEFLNQDDWELTLSDETTEKMKEWIEKMTTDKLLSAYSDYISKCHDAYKEAKESDGATTEEKIIEDASLKVAQTLVDKKWYSPELISFLTDDKTYINTRLFEALGKLDSENENKVLEIIDSCLLTCRDKHVTVDKMSWLTSYIIGTQQQSIVDQITPKLCELDYHQVLFSLYGIFRNEHEHLDAIFGYIEKVDLLDYEDFNYYLRMLGTKGPSIIISLYEAAKHDKRYCLSTIFFTWLFVFGDKKIEEVDKLLYVCQQTLLLSINEVIQDPRRLDEILKWTLKQNPDFSSDFCDAIIAMYKSDVKFNDKLYHEKLLKIVGDIAPEGMYKLAEFILSTPDIGFTLMSLNLEAGFEKPYGVLGHLDPDRLISIAQNNLQYGPKRLVKQLSLFDDTKESLHPSLLRVMEEFSDNEVAFDSLSSRLGTMLGWGSLIPLYEERLKIMEKLSNHSNSTIANWAKKEADGFRRSIEFDKQSNNDINPS